MNAPQKLRHSLLAAYRCGLSLYPAEFRDRYACELRRCAREMMEESASPFRISVLLADDLFRSLLKEYFGMTLNRVPQLAILLTLTTFIALTGYNISQQVLRMSANDPQIQMAEDAAQRLNAGEDAERIVPDHKVDMAASLAPFVIIYDDSGRPLGELAPTALLPGFLDKLAVAGIQLSPAVLERVNHANGGDNNHSHTNHSANNHADNNHAEDHSS